MKKGTKTKNKKDTKEWALEVGNYDKKNFTNPFIMWIVN